MSGSTPDQAAQHLAQMERTANPPFVFLGYGPLSELHKGKRRANPSKAPKHMALMEVYREFRQLVPSGRFSIMVGFKFDAKGEPREMIALDSQLMEKAQGLPLGGLTAGPEKPGSN
jgi:hypothetical protein